MQQQQLARGGLTQQDRFVMLPHQGDKFEQQVQPPNATDFPQAVSRQGFAAVAGASQTVEHSLGRRSEETTASPGAHILSYLTADTIASSLDGNCRLSIKDPTEGDCSRVAIPIVLWNEYELNGAQKRAKRTFCLCWGINRM
jgi:hypothetical protein